MFYSKLYYTAALWVLYNIQLCHEESLAVNCSGSGFIPTPLHLFLDLYLSIQNDWG